MHIIIFPAGQTLLNVAQTQYKANCTASSEQTDCHGALDEQDDTRWKAHGTSQQWIKIHLPQVYNISALEFKQLIEKYEIGLAKTVLIEFSNGQSIRVSCHI